VINGTGVTEAVTVMLRDECDLYVSDAGSRRFTWITVRCFLYLFMWSETVGLRKRPA